MQKRLWQYSGCAAEADWLGRSVFYQSPWHVTCINQALLLTLDSLFGASTPPECTLAQTFTSAIHFFVCSFVVFVIQPLNRSRSATQGEINTKWSFWVFWLLAFNVCDPYGWFKRFRQWVQRGAFLMTKLMWLSEWVWERGIEGLEEGNLLAEMNV